MLLTERAHEESGKAGEDGKCTCYNLLEVCCACIIHVLVFSCSFAMFLDPLLQSQQQFRFQVQHCSALVFERVTPPDPYDLVGRDVVILKMCARWDRYAAGRRSASRISRSFMGMDLSWMDLPSTSSRLPTNSLLP